LIHAFDTFNDLNPPASQEKPHPKVIPCSPYVVSRKPAFTYVSQNKEIVLFSKMAVASTQTQTIPSEDS